MRERFRGELLAGHKGCAVEVPFDPAQRFGIEKTRLRPGRFGHRVRGTVNGVPFEGAIVPRMKRFWLELDAATLERAKLAAGDTGTIAIEPASRS
jgi:hypothetical protein